jgi:hypothetical protein
MYFGNIPILHYEKKKENGKWKMEKSQSCMRPISHQLHHYWGKKWKVESGKWEIPILEGFYLVVTEATQNLIRCM